MYSEVMEERLKKFESDLQIFTYENILSITLLSIIYLLFRKYLYKFLEQIFEKRLASGSTIFERVDPRVYKLKVLPCIRRILSGIFLTIFAYQYLKKEEWIFSFDDYCKAYDIVPRNIKLQYYFEFTHYFVSIYFLCTDPRSKDFFQMVFHHLLSLVLIVYSYKKNVTRYGVIVMFLHEICDPFLEIGKVLSYFQYEKLKTIFFVLFTIAFFTFRFILFPYMIIIQIFYNIYRFHVYGYVFYLGCFLAVLYVLNFIWMMYIGQMCVFYLRNGYVGEDSRSFISSDK